MLAPLLGGVGGGLVHGEHEVGTLPFPPSSAPCQKPIFASSFCNSIWNSWRSFAGGLYPCFFGARPRRPNWSRYHAAVLPSLNVTLPLATAPGRAIWSTFTFTCPAPALGNSSSGSDSPVSSLGSTPAPRALVLRSTGLPDS